MPSFFLNTPRIEDLDYSPVKLEAPTSNLLRKKIWKKRKKRKKRKKERRKRGARALESARERERRRETFGFGAGKAEVKGKKT